MRVVAAFDKFRGTASAAEVGATVVRVAQRLGVDARSLPLSDGGEGLLDVLGGANRHTTVTGPLGEPVRAGWHLDDGVAMIESARASGLSLAGGAQGNRPMTATSRGTGELVDAAVAAGASRILVGLGGVASTDGGFGAIDALSTETLECLANASVELLACCDVRTGYEDAASMFGPQKGATPEQIRELTERLRRHREELLQRYGVDVATIAGAGAAGGLAGGLAAVGGRVRPGFEVVAERVGLDSVVRDCDLVLTGEGRLDASSLEGKVVGGVAGLARSAGVRVVAVVGDVEPAIQTPFRVVSLVGRFGGDRSRGDVHGCVEQVVAELLETLDY